MDALKDELEKSDVVIYKGAEVKEISGDNEVKSLELKDGTSIPVNGVFIELGAKGVMELALTLGVQLDEDAKYIQTNKQQETNISGIYAAGEDYSRLPNPPVWSWACGTRNCRVAVSTQEMPLTSVHAATNAWPLEEGDYVLILARNSAQPYTAFAVSAEFTIQEGC